MGIDWTAIATAAPQYGIAVASLALVYKIVSNHIEHNTAALTDLTKTLEGLKTWLEATRK